MLNILKKSPLSVFILGCLYVTASRTKARYITCPVSLGMSTQKYEQPKYCLMSLDYAIEGSIERIKNIKTSPKNLVQ